MRSAKLKRHRSSLLEMRSRLASNLDHAADAIRADANDPGTVSHFPTHVADHDSEGLDRDVVAASTQAGILAAVEAALERIDAGTYGVCRDCKEKIPARRLDVLPYADRCVTCEARHESRD